VRKPKPVLQRITLIQRMTLSATTHSQTTLEQTTLEQTTLKQRTTLKQKMT
jgi:hypothetical protein